MNRSFWTAATSSGLVVNMPLSKWFTKNDAETIFDRLEQHGKTWKVYVAEPSRVSVLGIQHYPRLKDRLATHFVPFSEFERVVANGRNRPIADVRTSGIDVGGLPRPLGRRSVTLWVPGNHAGCYSPPIQRTVAGKKSE
jgi:phospholipase C